MIHELTHVWQGVVDGPVYMVQALEAQASGEGYNYGYSNPQNGEGAQDELVAAAGNFGSFNRGSSRRRSSSIIGSAATDRGRTRHCRMSSGNRR